MFQEGQTVVHGLKSDEYEYGLCVLFRPAFFISTKSKAIAESSPIDWQPYPGRSFAGLRAGAILGDGLESGLDKGCVQ
jgi:hypothetical protein